MSDLHYLPLILIPAVLAVTMHEVAHGWVALQLGDTTAADAGRLSVNPLRHVDPIGTLLVPIGLYFLSDWLLGSRVFFGWAKPVPVKWQNLRPLRPAIAAVAVAGPGANLLMLGAWAVLALVLKHSPGAPGALIYMCQAGIIFNAAIMMINLIPIPPLDGSRIVTALLPAPWARRYNRFEVYGLLAILILLLSGGLQQIVRPVLGQLLELLDALGL